MNRKLLIALFVLSLFFNLVFFVFAYVQKIAADAAKQEAISQKQRALKNEMIAKANEEKSRLAMMEAERQAQLAIVCRAELEKASK